MRWRREWKKIEKGTPSNLPLYGEALQTSRTNYSKRTLLGECRAAEPSSSPRGADAKERRLRRREVYLSRGVLPQQSIRRGLQLLMHHRTPDGRYLMRRRYQWWAVYHVLVRQCGFPDGYREFVACIAQLFPEGLRVPCSESTMKQLSQTRYMEPVRDWRYDALYHGSPERFRLMRKTVEWLIEQWK